MDNYSILSWNVRGLNAKARRDAVRTLVDAKRASHICLQETKLNSVTDELMISMLGAQLASFAYLPAANCYKRWRINDDK
jgi:exonuclease III